MGCVMSSSQVADAKLLASYAKSVPKRPASLGIVRMGNWVMEPFPRQPGSEIARHFGHIPLQVNIRLTWKPKHIVLKWESPLRGRFFLFLEYFAAEQNPEFRAPSAPRLVQLARRWSTSPCEVQDTNS